jgi:hypothetical protein
MVMVEHSEVTFENEKCIKLSNDHLVLWLPTEFGPRILGLSLDGGENLLVVLPDAKIPVEGAEDYSLRGGHRLWYAPEHPLTTYITDDLPVAVQSGENWVECIQPVDHPTGIQKSIRVSIDETKAQVVLDHRLENLGEADFELAPWAVTMLRPGGIGVLPMQKTLDDEFGLHPNRQLVIWPYTELKSNHLDINDPAVLVKSTMTEGALKIGGPNPENWLAYVLGDDLFVKRASYQQGGHYLDRGASSQIYCNPDLIELETLGPVVELAPGERVEHQEIWEVYHKREWPGEIKGVLDMCGG